jgi:hypothetical protein
MNSGKQAATFRENRCPYTAATACHVPIRLEGPARTMRGVPPPSLRPFSASAHLLRA